MRWEDTRDAVAGIPFMTAEQGRRIYDHVRETRPEIVLELGTGYGVSAAYIAAALDENGTGRLVSVDHRSSASKYPPAETVAKASADLLSVVEFVREDASSYTWWLRARLEERTDKDGNTGPLYDFCYLDGAHHWTIDGLAVFLVERLLRPGGWLLLDDLDWSFGTKTQWADGEIAPFFPMSPDELRVPHMRSVFDLLLKTHPAFTSFSDEDGRWGWAKKDPAAPRTLRVETSTSPSALVLSVLRRLAARLRR
jgi:predicted O-methyltransferase YrrM